MSGFTRARLLLIRHGQTEWNRTGRMQGRSDIPLNDSGREQVEVRAEQLRATLPGAWDYHTIVSSPLVRARQSARIIAGVLGLDLLDDPCAGLVERNYGSAEGLTAPEVFEAWPVTRQYADQVDWTEGGSIEDLIFDTHPCRPERRRDVRERTFAAANQLLDDHPDGILGVSHGTAIRLLYWRITGHQAPHLDNAGAIEFERDEHGGWQVLAVSGATTPALPGVVTLPGPRSAVRPPAAGRSAAH
ncbi:histidine phosphatase family protein [Raineyella sp. W15-4]|uniref:histidine phosphatase family protein n=1 Tax=Raineyella sp. W15-4 TaxID=3081651 RepID=UPI002955216E|nr:histidine phosphatase family protein [Raineyella sp. W15-4]WOQ17872.1 histidine phosphatase family protein [Raineyella sp. W15-4]